MILTWRNDNKWKAWNHLDPLLSHRLFCLITHSLSLSRPVDFAMLWSSCASRPSGYLDIAWSQRPVNQISSDLAGPADKTLHGKRKWQTAGGHKAWLWRLGEARLIKTALQTPKRLPRMKIYCLCLFFSIYIDWIWFGPYWQVLVFSSDEKTTTRCYKFSLTKGWMKKGTFSRMYVILYCTYTNKKSLGVKVRNHFKIYMSENI